jgi:hypothetical protein
MMEGEARRYRRDRAEKEREQDEEEIEQRFIKHNFKYEDQQAPIAAGILKKMSHRTTKHYHR